MPPTRPETSSEVSKNYTFSCFSACLIFHNFSNFSHPFFIDFWPPQVLRCAIKPIENQHFHASKKSSFFITFGLPKSPPKPKKDLLLSSRNLSRERTESDTYFSTKRYCGRQSSNPRVFRIALGLNGACCHQYTTMTDLLVLKSAPYSNVFLCVLLFLFEGTTLTCSMNSFSWRVLPWSYVFVCVLLSLLLLEGTTITCSMNS